MPGGSDLRRPRDDDLEHEGDEEDIAFYLRFSMRWLRTSTRQLIALGLKTRGDAPCC